MNDNMTEGWVSAVYTKRKKKEKRVNILPDGSPSPAFIAESDGRFNDSRIFAFRSVGGGREIVVSVESSHTGDEGGLVETESHAVLSVKQARELAYWLLATAEKMAR